MVGKPTQPRLGNAVRLLLDEIYASALVTLLGEEGTDPVIGASLRPAGVPDAKQLPSNSVFAVRIMHL